MKLRLLIALSAMLLPRGARAEEPTWGLLAYDAKGEFVGAYWPTEPTALIGSASDSNLVLPELTGRVEVRRSADGVGFSVVPLDEVSIVHAGSTITVATDVSKDAVLELGGYRVSFVEARGSEDEKANETIEGQSIEAVGAGERAAAARKAEFEQTAYHFCHDPEFGKDGVVGADFCVIFDDKSDDVCPEAKKHCKEWKELTGKLELSKGGRKAANSRTAKRRESVLLPRLPPEVAYVVLALLIGTLLFWFVRSLKDAGWEKEQLDLETVDLDAAARNLQSLPDARTPVLLKMAERAHARGDDLEAAILLHLAILRHLDDEGIARYHASKTNGDYLRAIRKLKPMASLFRRVANQTERIRFGDGRVDGTEIPTLLAEAKELLVKGSGLPGPSPSWPRAASGPAILLFALSMSTQGCGGFGGETQGGKPYYEHGPSGMAALPDVLEAAGLEVKISRERLVDVPSDVGTVVIRTAASGLKAWPTDLNLDALLDRGTSILVIDDLGKAPSLLPVTATISGPPGAIELEIYANADESCVDVIVGLDEQAGLDPVLLPNGVMLKKLPISETASTTVSKHPVALYTFIAPVDDRSESWADSAGNALVGVRLDDTDHTLAGCIYWFADRDLFTNASLTRSSNARFVGQLFARITRGKKVLILDRLDRWVTSSEGDAESDDPPPDPSKALKASNLLPFLLQSFASLALLYVFLGAAFGKLRDPAKREHKNFVEHVEAIGRHYAAAGQAGLTHSAQSLAKLVVMRNRERVRSGGAHGAHGWAGLAQDLSRQHELPENDVRAALRLGIEGLSDLGTPKPDDPPPSSERMLKTLSRLLSGRAESLQLKRRKKKKRSKSP